MRTWLPHPAQPRPTGRAWSLLSALALSAFLWAGCSYPRPVRTYEIVTQYDRMTDRFDPLLSLVYVPDVAALSGYRNFVIGEVEPGKRWVKSPKTVEHYAAFFRLMLQKQLARTRRFTFVALDPEARFLSPTLIMDARITRFRMGYGALRYLGGLFFVLEPLGATDLQIEGRITDARSGALIAEFVDRRRHVGNTSWGPNPRTFKNDFVMKLTMRQTAECLARFIGRLHAGMPPD